MKLGRTLASIDIDIEGTAEFAQAEFNYHPAASEATELGDYNYEKAQYQDIGKMTKRILKLLKVLQSGEPGYKFNMITFTAKDQNNVYIESMRIYDSYDGYHVTKLGGHDGYTYIDDCILNNEAKDTLFQWKVRTLIRRYYNLMINEWKKYQYVKV